MKVALRPAVPQDAAKIRECYDYYIHHTQATFTETLKPLEAYAESIASLSQTYPFFVAVGEDGRFLGFANAEPLRPQTGYRYAAELTIYLHPQAPRRCGVGIQLYGAVLDCLTAQHFCQAYGVVNSVNEESLALHRHFGFRQVGFLENSGYKHGKWLSAVWLVKQLNPPQNPPPALIPFSQYRVRFQAED